jgi:predicted dehydrogenase
MDGYVVASPTHTHADVVGGLLGTDRPIFVEKPMTADVESARRLARDGAGRLFVMHKWRYHPGIEAMRAEISAGRVGEVLAIRTERWGWGHAHSDVSPLWTLGPHDLSIVLHLLGEIPQVTSVAPVAPAHPELGLLTRLGGDREPSVILDLGVASPSYRRRCLVVGSQATLELRGEQDDRITIRAGSPGALDARERVAEVGMSLPSAVELRRFLAFLDGGPAPHSSAVEGLCVVERLAAIEAALAANS